MLEKYLIAGDYQLNRDDFHGNKNMYYIVSKSFGYTNVSYSEYYVEIHDNVATIYFPKWESKTIQKLIYSWVLYWLTKSGENNNYTIKCNNENCVVPSEKEIKHSHKVFDMLSTDEFSDYTFWDIERYYEDRDEFPENCYDLEEYLFDN